jgi:hypothetical protein
LQPMKAHQVIASYLQPSCRRLSVGLCATGMPPAPSSGGD